MNWVDIVVIVILAISVIQGWRKGLILAIVGFIKWFVGFAVAKVFYKTITAFFIANIWNPIPGISLKVQGFLYETMGLDPSLNFTMTPEQLRLAFSKLTLPDMYKTALDGMIPTSPMSVSNFMTILADKMSLVLVEALGFLMVMLVAIGLFSLVGKVINTISKLPVLNELNRGGGLLIGGLIGLITVYFLMAMLNYLYPLPIATSVTSAIENSKIAVYFYKYNVLSYFLNSLFQANKIFGNA